MTFLLRPAAGTVCLGQITVGTISKDDATAEVGSSADADGVYCGDEKSKIYGINRIKT